MSAAAAESRGWLEAFSRIVAAESEVPSVASAADGRKLEERLNGIGGDLEQLQQLHGRIQAAMADLGFPPEARRYKPHVTLGRLRKGRRVSEDCIAELHEVATTHFGTMQVDEVVVLSSE